MGVAGAPVLQPVADLKWVRRSVVAIVLFLMALPLEPRAVWKTLRRPTAPLLASMVNFGLLPLAAWLLAQPLGNEMRFGMYVAAATPCTLASASVWTRRAGGNDAVAIVVTVLTNLSCFLLTPLWLVALTGQQVESEALQLSNMVVKLGILVVLPMTLAQVIRRLAPSFAGWTTHNKTALGVGAQVGVLTMVMLGAVQTGLRLRQPSADDIVADVVLMMVLVMTLHLTMLVVGMLSARAIGLTREDQIAVGFAGSQKTLMVGLQVGMEAGFSILPMVTYHVGQLLVDTLIADWLRSRAKQRAKPPDEPPDEPADEPASD